MKKITISHGDVQLYPSSKKAIGLAKKVEHNGSFTLAFGEVTNHSHRITVDRPETMGIYRTDDGKVFLVLTEPGKLDHEEHGVLTVPPGVYEQGAEREHDWFSNVTRRVVD